MAYCGRPTDTRKSNISFPCSHCTICAKRFKQRSKSARWIAEKTYCRHKVTCKINCAFFFFLRKVNLCRGFTVVELLSNVPFFSNIIFILRFLALLRGLAGSLMKYFCVCFSLKVDKLYCKKTE